MVGLKIYKCLAYFRVGIVYTPMLEVRGRDGNARRLYRSVIMNRSLSKLGIHKICIGLWHRSICMYDLEILGMGCNVETYLELSDAD